LPVFFIDTCEEKIQLSNATFRSQNGEGTGEIEPNLAYWDCLACKGMGRSWRQPPCHSFIPHFTTLLSLTTSLYPPGHPLLPNPIIVLHTQTYFLTLTSFMTKTLFIRVDKHIHTLTHMYVKYILTKHPHATPNTRTRTASWCR